VLQVWSRRVLGLVLSLVAFAVTPRVMDAQTGKIAGVVTDQATGQPVEGAQVFLQGTGYGTVTNTSGRYFLISVPPGSYTVTAKRIGYAQQDRPNVQVQIDVTRELNFALSTATAVLTRQVITAPVTPLIPQGQTQSSIVLNAEQITALPATSIEGALALQQGFTLVPTNSTDLISYSESRRSATNPVRIRGGRGGETLQMIDLIPVNNFIFGGRAFELNPLAVEQLDLIKGGMDPQYGNALSGVINIATKEGGSDLAGSVHYFTSRVGDALGNSQDALRGYNMVQGFVSGPVPGTGAKLTFLLAGREERQADQVFEYDDDIFVPSARGTNNQALPTGGPNFRDVFPGFRAFGFDNQRQVFGKLAYRFTPTAKLGVTFLDNEDQRKPFDNQFLPTYGSLLNSPGARTPEDSAAYIGNLTGYRLDPIAFERVVQSSIDANQQLVSGRYDQTFGRTSMTLVAGTFRTKRETCNYFQGVCLGTNFADANFTDDQFIGPLSGACELGPTCGNDQDFGGEKLTTVVLRGDLQSQVTDHHNLQGGVLYQGYDFSVNTQRNVGTNAVNVYRQSYANKPYDFATYLQDRIEYDFLTLKIGARFDYGSVPGRFFADPLDPTNGTTAADVCANPSDARWAGKDVIFTDFDENGRPVPDTARANPAWTSADCASDEVRSEAAKVAAADDFKSAKARTQFSPRIGVSFPLSATSSVFFNFGRMSQNPLLNNLLTNTGIGTARAGSTRGPVLEVVGEGDAGFIGNPGLAVERSTTYEIGYTGEFRTNYALAVTLFNKNQTGLTGLRTGGVRRGARGLEQVFDPGVTYGSSTPSYRILVNQDFQSVRGFEMQLRRRVSDYWGFDVNYSYSRARTNASDPEREFERQAVQLEPNVLTEVPSDIDQPHVFNASLTGQVRNEAPGFPGGWLLRNTLGTITYTSASGLPYSPTADYVGDLTTSRFVRNAGRGPSTSVVSLLAQKGFALSNLRYDLFMQVNNLLDTKNCVQVFTTTGRCDAGAIDQNRARQGNFVRPDIATSTFGDRADYYGPRRSVLGGIKVNF
jgi:outer membrane receptor protein involved in Fe transport